MFNLYITFILGVVVFQIAIVCANNTDCLNGHNLNIELAIALRDRIKCIKKAGKYQLVLLISSFINLFVAKMDIKTIASFCFMPKRGYYEC